MSRGQSRAEEKEEKETAEEEKERKEKRRQQKEEAKQEAQIAKTAREGGTLHPIHGGVPLKPPWIPKTHIWSPYEMRWIPEKQHMSDNLGSPMKLLTRPVTPPRRNLVEETQKWKQWLMAGGGINTLIPEVKSPNKKNIQGWYGTPKPGMPTMWKDQKDGVTHTLDGYLSPDGREEFSIKDLRIEKPVTTRDGFSEVYVYERQTKVTMDHTDAAMIADEIDNLVRLADPDNDDHTPPGSQKNTSHLAHSSKNSKKGVRDLKSPQSSHRDAAGSAFGSRSVLTGTHSKAESQRSDGERHSFADAFAAPDENTGELQRVENVKELKERVTAEKQEAANKRKRRALERMSLRSREDRETRDLEDTPLHLRKIHPMYRAKESFPMYQLVEMEKKLGEAFDTLEAAKGERERGILDRRSLISFLCRSQPRSLAPDEYGSPIEDDHEITQITLLEWTNWIDATFREHGNPVRETQIITWQQFEKIFWTALTDQTTRAPRSISFLIQFLMSSPTSVTTGRVDVKDLLSTMTLHFGLNDRQKEAMQRSFLLRLGVLLKQGVTEDITFQEFNHIMQEMVEIRPRPKTPEDPSIIKARELANAAQKKKEYIQKKKAKRRAEGLPSDSESDEDGEPGSPKSPHELRAGADSRMSGMTGTVALSRMSGLTAESKVV